MGFLSLRVFTIYLTDNQSNCHKLALEGRMQGASGLIITRSWYNGIDSINKISINTILQTKTVIIYEVDSRKEEDQIQNIWLWYFLWEVSIRTINRVYWGSSRFDKVVMQCWACGEEKELTRQRNRTDSLSKTTAKVHYCINSWMMEWIYSSRSALGM